MRKRDELSDPTSCMSRARDDELTFVLLGRDAAAPVAIRAWVAERVRLGKNRPDDPQIVEAEQCALAMDAERAGPIEAMPVAKAKESAKIEILCGMIAAGKSTYARRRADEGALAVCHDDLTGMLHARYRYEPELRGVYRRMEEQLAFAGICAGRDVVIDRTHLTRESRARWVAFARTWFEAAGLAIPTIVAVAFPRSFPEHHARRRYEADPRGRSYDEWLAVARHHDAQATAEPLEQSEGFESVIRVDGA